jgi:asparagine synthase (glutamine-hydrolysing)
VPLESYYQSRTSTPFTFFNSNAGDFYSREFADAANKERSIAPIRAYFDKAARYGVLEKMLYVDTKSSLPDDLLLKADKMTMANSIELRVPFLDHKVVEFAAALPPDLKLRWFTTKYLAKKALSAQVPKEILQRRKAGFPVPYESWLRTDLKGWLHEVLLDSRTLDRGYFEKVSIIRLVDQNQRSGRYSKEIFSLAVLELWHRMFEAATPEPQPVTAAPLAT